MLVLLVGASSVPAERVSTDQAAAAVRGWIGGGRTLGQPLEKEIASAQVAVSACVSTAYTKDGGYKRDPVPKIGNVCGQDLTLLKATPDDPAPGIWTTNVAAVRKAALADGSMIAVLSSNVKTCGYCQSLDALACGKDFLEWARQKGVYLVSADQSKYLDTAEALKWFRSASHSSEYPTIVFFDAKEGFPCLGEGVFREGRKINGNVYASTLASLKTCFASFIPEYAEHWDNPIVTNKDRYEFAPGSPMPPLEVAVAGLPDPKIAIKGLPSGLKFTAKRLTVAKTKTAPAYEVGPDSIYGVPTKSGVYKVTVTATSPDRPGVTASGEMTLVIRAADESVVNVTWDAKDGKVSGAGVYKAGKKITLKAVAAKGCVFDRWNGMSDETLARKASCSYAVPVEDVDLEAVFVAAEEVKKSIVVRNGEFTCDAAVPKVAVEARQGAYRQWQLAAEARIPVEEIKVTGLPSGLKFTAKAIVDKKTGETNVTANTIYGYPTAASKRDGATGGFKPTGVSVTVKTAGKVSEKYTLLVTVLPLPGWAVGNFAGTVEADGYCGPAKLTVGKTGKVSGSFSTLVDGKVKKWSFSVTGFDQADDDSLRLSTVAKSSKSEIGFRLAVASDGRQDGLAAATATAEWDSGLMTLWRAVWSDSGASARVAPMEGLYTARLISEDTGSGYLSLKVDSKGGVKAAGKLPDGTGASSSMTLVLRGEKFVAPWYQAPSAYAGGYVHSFLSLGADRSSGVEGEAEWTSLSDKATAEYGAGFSRTLSVAGAYYDSALALESQFGKLSLAAESPQLEYTFKSTERDEKGKKRTESELRMAESMTETTCEVTVGKNGKLSVPKAAKPVKDKQTGVWTYAGENVEAVTISFAKSTGVFKGTFTCWYDYLASVDSTAKTPEKTAHSSKKYTFEGVWVQGEPSLKGYFLVERTGSYEDGKSGKEKTFKYKLSVPATLAPVDE